ncbi:MAG: valine--tRNA ligase [Candidatus Yanofskybacteria bacterium]|nr:valine--tRNA ligase [Candidatus Yanofskybacteria bacterium]
MDTFNKTYNPKETEDKIYKLWLESGFFIPSSATSFAKATKVKKATGNKPEKKFVTCIAPPNITGELHMGHALEYTLQDIIVRVKRMQGYRTLWLPGIDHAGIAAQNAVEKQLTKENISRHKLGREKFLERMWQWRDQYGNVILEQLKKLGASLDWTRLRFTMDPDYQKAVQEAFIHYYKKGWIYQGERVINWCIRCATSISDLEVNYIPEKAKLYYIKYGRFTLATVRPETKLGDTALAVHPNDERYKKYIGEDLEIETVDNDLPLEQAAKVKKIKIKVVADEAVDPEFGTGIVKVTPAHDLTDFEIAQRQNLPSLKIIDEHGRMNENAGIRYQGLKTAEARERIVKDLETLGLIEKIDGYEHNIARCDRCNSVIEPLPSKQWFLKMKELARFALVALRKKEVRLHPERWSGALEHWLDPKNIRDWNISRQLWWGHRLPVWHHEPKCVPKPGHEKDIDKCIDMKVSAEKPICEYCDAKFMQSEDVLDTWFSSALWPFATLGWPQDSEAQPPREVEPPKIPSDFKEYYPTDFITSDRGILFLWQARMIFSGLEFTGKVPFKDIYIHATILTKDGKRMSKSLGTGVNPLDLIEKYGTDALRFGLASQATGLQDLRFGEDLLVMGKKFANKIWNITRYVTMKSEILNPKSETISKSEIPIIQKMNGVAKTVTENIEKYNFAEAANSLYKFIWHEFADKYIEESKDQDDQETKDTLAYLLINSLKLLHPFMPFLTEEIWSKLPIPDKKLLLVEDWPS